MAAQLCEPRELVPGHVGPRWPTVHVNKQTAHAQQRPFELSPCVRYGRFSNKLNNWRQIFYGTV